MVKKFSAKSEKEEFEVTLKQHGRFIRTNRVLRGKERRVASRAGLTGNHYVRVRLNGTVKGRAVSGEVVPEHKEERFITLVFDNAPDTQQIIDAIDDVIDDNSERYLNEATQAGAPYTGAVAADIKEYFELL